MPMTPHKDETQSEFMARCVPEAIGTGDDKRPQDQAVAMCMSMWREGHKPMDGDGMPMDGKQVGVDDYNIEPDEGESESEFMDRCTTELADGGIDDDEAEERCQMLWEYSGGGNGERAMRGRIHHKTHAGLVNGMEFCLSDETPDRMGDVIMSSGWHIDSFRNNPIALWNHSSNFPIGTWENLRVDKVTRSLRGHLRLAPEGTSERIDEIRKLIDAGILRAVSVGFRSIASEPRRIDGKYLGEVYTKQELVETSLVSVPANPNALAIAKSLVSADTFKLVFAGSGNRDGSRGRGVTGGPAKTSQATGGKTMSLSIPLSKRIQDTEGRLNTFRDALQTHLDNVDDSNVSDAQYNITSELNDKITRETKSLAMLRESEAQLASTIDAAFTGVNGGNGSGGEPVHDVRMPTREISTYTRPSNRPFAVPGKKIKNEDYVWRSLAVLVKHHAQKGQKPMQEILRETYGEDEATRAVMNVITRASTVPAQTTLTTWAAELIAIVMGEFLSALIPVSVFPKIASRGSSFTFGRAGAINLPIRAPSPAIAGAFVGEGAPIPVRQGQFLTQQMTPKKLGVITTFTREIADHSTPAIEGILRDAVIEDTGVALDSVLLDTNAATAIRPAGLLSGTAGITGTAGGGFNAVVGDVKLLGNALITASRGNFRQPLWLMNPGTALSLALTPASGVQQLPFRDEVSRGTFMGYPIVQSTTVTAGTVVLMDCADFASVTGDDPRFEISDQAVLHMEDTAPLQIGTPGTPPTVAAPTRSLWQTDTIGLRLIMPMNWTVRRSGMVQHIDAVSWQ